MTSLKEQELSSTKIIPYPTFSGQRGAKYVAHKCEAFFMFMRCHSFRESWISRTSVDRLLVFCCLLLWLLLYLTWHSLKQRLRGLSVFSGVILIIRNIVPSNHYWRVSFPWIQIEEWNPWHCAPFVVPGKLNSVRLDFIVAPHASSRSIANE